MSTDAARRASRKRGGSATKDQAKERRRTAAATARAERGTWDNTDRDALAEQYLPLAEVIAARMRIAIDPDERQSAAHVALLQAIDRFDPRRGMSFESYLYATVQRALLDAARAADHLPRMSRRRWREADTIVERLSHELGRLPSDEEIIAAGGDPAYLRMHMRLRPQSIDARMSRDQGAVVRDQGPTVADARGPQRCDEIPFVNDEQWKQALRSLSIDEFIVLYLLHKKSIRMKDIGAVLHLSESRVSQIHSHACERLFGRREELYEAFGK